MLHDDLDSKSTSTRVTAQSKAATFAISAKREMYKQVQQKNKVQLHIHNALKLNLVHAGQVTAPEVKILEDEEHMVAINDGHYNLIDSRSRSTYINRNTEAGSKLLFSMARKPGKFIFFQTMEKANNIIHINIIKFNPQDESQERRDIYLPLEPNQEIVGFQTVQNSKKAILIKKASSLYTAELFLMKKDNRIRNVKGDFEYNPLETASVAFDMDEDEKVLKLIKSEYGDMVMMITNKDILEVEVEASSIYTKRVNFLHKLNKYLTDSGREQVGPDEIVDASYIYGGIKIIFCTKKGLIGIIDTAHIRYLKHMSTLTNLDLPLKSIHSLEGKVMLTTTTKEAIILKEENDLTYEKIIELETANRNEVLSYSCKVMPKGNELILLLVVKEEKLKLQVMKKSLVSFGNQFQLLYESPYQPTSNNSPLHISRSFMNQIDAMASGNEVKLIKRGKGQLFSTNFYEKCTGVSLDVYGSNVVVMFREFVKFFKFQYQNLQSFYTLNERNVGYASYTSNGQYLLMHFQQVLHFINPYTFLTEKSLIVHGDIRNVHFFDTILYIECKLKNNNRNILIYSIEDREQYAKIFDLQIRENECYFVDRDKMIVCGSRYIAIYTRGEEELEKEKKEINLDQEEEYPTTMELIEDIGFILVGTNKGKLYQWMWPFTYQSLLQHFVVNVSESAIIRIVPSITMNKVQLYTQNKSMFSFEIVQIVEGEELLNNYAINSKTLYTENLKYQFVSKDELYTDYTSYINEYKLQAQQNVDELEFLIQKQKDDQLEFKNKNKQQIEEDSETIKKQDSTAKKTSRDEINGIKSINLEKFKEAEAVLQEEKVQCEMKKKTLIDEYEEKMLKIYAEAQRLKSTIETQRRRIKTDRYQYRIKNQEVYHAFVQEQENNMQMLVRKYQQMLESGQLYKEQVDREKEKGEQQLKLLSDLLKQEVIDDLKKEEKRTEELLSAINYHQHEIDRHKKRRNEFELIIMETGLQVADLQVDKVEYAKKKAILDKDIKQKEGLIEKKENELMKYINNTQAMAKTKEIHSYELAEYQKEILPITQKQKEIDERIKNMNQELLNEFNSRIERKKQIKEQLDRQQELKQTLEKKILGKWVSIFKVKRFVESLNTLLTKQIGKNIKKQLYELAMGQKYKIDEEQIKYKEQNKKLQRRKDAVTTKLEEQKKKEKYLLKNKNQYLKHFNENTLLLRELQDLKQTQNQLQSKKISLESQVNQLKEINQISYSRSQSVSSIKKQSLELLETPFQKHEKQQLQLLKRNSLPTDTSKKSNTFLRSLLKDVQVAESQYQKMDLVKQRVRSFVNPEQTTMKGFKAKGLMN